MLDMTKYLEDITTDLFTAETIATQPLGKYIKIEDQLREIVEYLGRGPKIKWERLDGLFAKDLSDLIFDLFGIKTKMTFRPGYLAATTTIRANQRHTLSPTGLREWLTAGELKDDQLVKWQKQLQKNVGTVDLDLAKIGGVYSKLDHTTYFDIRTMSQSIRLSVREMTAVLLHEIGHCFTYFEYQTKLVSTNQVLLDVRLDAHGSKGTHKHIFLDNGGDRLLTDKQLKDLEKDTTEKVMSYRLSKDLIYNMVSELPYDKYDGSSGEQLGDAFATRCGYGKELVTGLAKLHRGNLIESVVSVAVSTIYILVMPVLLLVVLLQGSFMVALFATFMIIITFMGSNTNNKDITYDNDKNRYRRIRENLISMIKDLKLERKFKEPVLEAIDLLKTYERQASNNPVLFNMIGDLFSSRSRSIKEDIRLQQQLERLANNELFVAAAKLSV